MALRTAAAVVERHVRACLIVVLGAWVALGCGPVAVESGAPAAVLPAREANAPVAEPPAAGRAVPAPRDMSEEGRTEAYAQLAATLSQGSSVAPFSGKLANWPITGRVTSPFGPRWGGFHTGLDIAAPMNAEVRAAAAGQVVAAGKPYLAFGDTATIVIIAHTGDLATVYVHLSDGRPPIVRAGDRVAAGQVIAYCGSTGFSTGPHVHFMTVLKGRAVDPIPYLP